MKTFKFITLVLFFVIQTPFVFAGDHSKHKGHEIDHSKHIGDNIHETTVDGYKFVYHLIDMQEKMKKMKAMKDKMPKIKNTHHLMVYIMEPNGKMVSNAKIGYMIKGPDGKKQKTMVMGMSHGFGADVNLKHKGEYKITTKALVGTKKLVNSFDYTVD